MAKSTIFKNPQVLEESIFDQKYELTSLQQKEKNRISERISAWKQSEKSSTFAYLGPYGVGKTAVLNTLKKELKDSNTLWLETFETWQYPDRKSLWDAFVIEVVSQLQGEGDEKEEKVAGQLEGEKQDIVSRFVREKLGNPFISLSIFFFCSAIYLGFAWVLWSVFRHEYGTVFLGHASFFTSTFWESFLKYGFPVLIPILGFFGISTLLPTPNRPLKRIFQLRKKLKQAFHERSEDYFIVVAEDIDRAGEEGFVFLESLDFFIKNELNTKLVSGKKKHVLVIAPQSQEYFAVTNNDLKIGFQRGLKIYDSSIQTCLKITVGEISDLFKELGYKRKMSVVVQGLKSFIKLLIQKFSPQLSLRQVKFILRQTNEYLLIHQGYDPVLVFFIIFSHYVTVLEVDSKESLILREGILRPRPVRVSDDVGATLRILSQYLHDTPMDGDNRIQMEFAEMDKDFAVEIEKYHSSHLKLIKVLINSKYQELL